MKQLLLILMLAVFTNGYTQNESNIWYFGPSGLDFNSEPPVVLSNGQLPLSEEGCASISTADGMLMFYTDGITVYNSQHTIMVNGTGLLGGISSTQSVIIVPKPCAPNIYYIFTTMHAGLAEGLRYSEVDMTLDNGLGAVTENKNFPLFTPVCEKVTAVPKADGTGFWVLTHGIESNQFLAFSVSAEGVNPNPVYSYSGTVLEWYGSGGCLTPSHDGIKLVSCNYGQNVELFDFDAASGMVSNGQVLNAEPGYGAEFSPSGNLLYVSTGDSLNGLVQYDLTAPDIPASAVVLANVTDPGIYYPFCTLQLAPDGNIYIANGYSPHISVIYNPDVPGTGCGFVSNAITFSNIVSFGLPQEILPRPAVTAIDVTVQDVCLGTATVFGVSACQPVNSATWDFGDGTTSAELAPSHTYAAAGTFNVVTTAIIAGASVQQTSQAIVFDTPVANEIPDQTVCGDLGMMYNLAQNDATLWGSQASDFFIRGYYSSLQDAQAHTNPLALNYPLAAGPNIFYVGVYNPEHPACYAIETFTVNLATAAPVLPAVPNLQSCDTGTADGFTAFNLSQQDAALLAGQTGSTVTYYTSQANAEAGTGAIATSAAFTNTVNPQTIYAAVTAPGGCPGYTTFTISVILTPVLPVVPNLQSCDTGTADGFADFNLSQQDAPLLAGQTGSTIAYYTSQANAEAGTGGIAIPAAFTNTVNPQTIYAALTTTAGCKSFTAFTVTVTPTPVLPAVPNLQSCDSAPSDGLVAFNLTQQDTALLAGQTGSTVTYYTSQADAEAGTGPIATPAAFTNTVNPQTIYAAVTTTTGCQSYTSFTISVLAAPAVVSLPAIELCDDSVADGFTTFNLTQQDAASLAGQAGVTIAYFTSQANADANSNAIASPAAFVNTAATQTIYVRVSSATCYATTSFTIVVKPVPTADIPANVNACDSYTLPALSANNTYYTGPGATGTVLAAGSTILSNQTVYVHAVNGLCSAEGSFTIAITPTPILNPDTPIAGACVGTDYILTAVFADEEDMYNPDNVDFAWTNTADETIELGTSEDLAIINKGTYHLVVTPKSGSCPTEAFIEVDDTSCSIQKGISPGDPGDNNYFDLSRLEIKKLSIFNRYGLEVYTRNNYKKEWGGQTNNGEELLTGTYFYMFERANGESKTGWIYLNRQN